VSDVENSFDKMHKKAISSCRQIEIYARSRCCSKGAVGVGRWAWCCSDSWVNKYVYMRIYIVGVYREKARRHSAMYFEYEDAATT